MEKLRATVRNKTEVFFEAECLSVSMKNSVGSFDILPEHAHFISTIFGEVSIGLVGKNPWSKRFKRGVARVVDDVVEVVILED